jgi:hypothetical protein
VVIKLMGEVTATRYLGHVFDSNVTAIVPRDPRHLAAVWCYATSDQFRAALKNVEQAVKVNNATVGKIPFDLDLWSAIAEERFPTGLGEPMSADPTQWVFAGNASRSSYPLHVAVPLALNFRWPGQENSTDCHSREVDSVACLAPLLSESSAGDRTRKTLADAYQAHWSADVLTSLLGGRDSLDVWLRHFFFTEHCELFDHRPFIWHIWDGQHEGFHAFANYHKLTAPNGEGRKTLERVTYTLLNDWIERQRFEVERNVDGAETRLAAALHLQSELKKILGGEPPYDIFVRWKPLHEQPIGWEPDINDGVRVNIRPFLNAKPYKPSRKDSCILRVTPKISYRKDKGKECSRPKEDYPWFWGWDERTQDFGGKDRFDGARWNDLHYSNEIKRKARAKKAEADASKS